MEAYRNEQLQKYKGVKGWLLVLCLALTVFSPLVSIINLSSGYYMTSDFFPAFPGVEKIFYLDSLLSLIMIILGVRAGLALWTVKPGAVKTAKTYFLILLAYSVVAAALPFMAGLPSEVNYAMLPEMVVGLLQSLIFFRIWFSYLNRSKRVRATYSTENTNEEFETQLVER